MTGQPVESADLKHVKDAIPATPVFANTGVNIDNVGDVLSIADGAVIGTHFKVDGNTWNAVDKTRVKRFMDKVRKLRWQNAPAARPRYRHDLDHRHPDR